MLFGHNTYRHGDIQYKQVYNYREKKHPYDCFTNVSEDKSIPTTALWCPSFSKINNYYYIVFQ